MQQRHRLVVRAVASALVAIAVLASMMWVSRALWRTRSDGASFIRTIRDGRIDEVHKALTDGANANASCLIPLGGGLGETAMHAAVDRGDAEVIRLLVAHGADIEIKSAGNQETPLMYAVRSGKPSVVEALLQAGADPNAQKGDRSDTTALMVAIEHGAHESIAILAAHGADMNKPNSRGATPWQVASQMYPDSDVLRALREAGAR